MDNGQIDSIIPDLFSKALPREQSTLSQNPPVASAISTATVSRHVLPNDLPAAIRHLDDRELDQLQAAVTAEQQRRGKKSPVPDQIPSKRSVEGVALTPGKLN